ncbi:MAG: T9SS type A sorting domain-containing protein, partial [Ignavibacteriae bacterium]|nr:T9SS type A sorting domain-containing protein [Ignavibacteriota bacterium]
ITVQLKDVNGNNLTSGGATVALSTTSGSLGSVTDNSNGTYSATLTSSIVTGTATITGTLNGSAITDDATVMFTVGSASTVTSTITASPTSITANGTSTSTITVQLKDVNGNNLTTGGATVALSTTSGSLGSVTDNNNGTYTATLTSSIVAGTATITGTLNSNPITDDATVTFTVGSASTATSTITAAPTSITANGTSTSTITVQLKDVNGNNLTTGGATVALSTTSGSLGSVTDNNNGTYTATLTSSIVAGTATITGTLNGSAITDDATVTFTVGAASTATSTITASPTSITANGTSTSTITIQLKDVNGNNLTTGGETVALSTTSGSLGSVTDNSNGTFSATLTSSTVAGTATITGTLNGSAITDDATVTFTAGSVNNFLVESASGGSIGSQTAGSPFSIKITARDQFGNTATSFTGTVTISSTGTLSSGSGITASFTAGVLSSHSVTISNTGTFTITATNTAGSETGTSNSFTVNAGAVNNFLVESSAGGNIGTQTAGTSFAIKITARDAGNNTVTSFTGTVDISSTGTLSSGSGTTVAFTAGVLSSHSVTITNSGTFTITATKTGSSESGTSNSFVVNAATLDHFLVQSSSGGSISTQTAGTTFAIKVTAKDVFNNTVTAFTGTVDISSTGTLSMGGGTTAPFTSGVLSSHSVTISNTGSFTITATKTSGVEFGTSNSFTVSAGSVNNFVVEAFGGGNIGAQTAGVPFAITITAYDALGNVATGFTGTVNVTSTGTITAGSGTTLAFTAGVLASHSITISSVGTYTVTATRTGGAQNGVSNSFVVNPGLLSTFLVEKQGGGNIGSQRTNISFNIRLTAKDAFGNTIPTFTGTADISSTGTLSAGSGTTSAFVAGVLTSHTVAISNNGTFTITATATGSSESGTSNSFSVLGASVSGNAYNDANSNGVKDVGENGLSGWTINVTGTNPVNNQTVTTAAGGNYTISNLAADTYTIALQMQTNWSATVPVTATYTVAITNGIDTTGFTFGAVTAGSGTMMRTFTPQELGVKKAVKKKNVNTKFTFHFVNRTRQSVDGLSVEFNGSVSSIEVHTPFSIYYDTDQRGQDWEFRGTTIAPGETVTVTGYTNSKAMDAGKYWWTSGGQIIEWTKGFLRPTEKINLLPMPNMANVRDDVFARMGGILVGVARPDSKKVYGWVNLTKSADFQRSMYDKHEHYGPARGFTVYGKGPKVMGQLRNMPPSRYNNKLFAHVTALKFSIEASALQVTPAGLGELIYDEGTNPLSGLQLKEIVRKIDTALTYWRHRSPAEYINYDTTLGKILNAFSGSMDTTSWGDSLVLEGTRPISDVSFLRVNPNVPPVIKSRENVVTVEEETPEKFALNQNYPNPFNPVTNFGFRIADLGLVTLKVYDMLGREVATLIDKQETEEGEYEFQFDGSNLPSGVYAYRLTVESTNDEGVSRTFTDVKRMMLLK